MRLRLRFAAILCLAFSVSAFADDASKVKDAVKRSTLDQAGTKPFHLKATVAPSKERHSASGRTGEIEIWWASPTRIRREVRTQGFHQLEIIDGDHRWQKNEGDYFPEWLRETAVEVIRPIPDLDEALAGVGEADVKTLMGNTYFHWVRKGKSGNVALHNDTGLLFYCGGLGWGALFEDYRDFHGRKISRKVKVGTPEVTATVETLEDLTSMSAELFDAQAPGSDARLLDTVIAESDDALKHLVNPEPVKWPTVDDGPFEGNASADVEIDREGKIRSMGMVDQPGNERYRTGCDIGDEV
jgi:hypothetical protein